MPPVPRGLAHRRHRHRSHRLPAPHLHGEAGVNADADAEHVVLRRFRRVGGGGVIVGRTDGLRVGTITALSTNDRRVIAKRLQGLRVCAIRLRCNRYASRRCVNRLPTASCKDNAPHVVRAVVDPLVPANRHASP